MGSSRKNPIRGVDDMDFQIKKGLGNPVNFSRCYGNSVQFFVWALGNSIEFVKIFREVSEIPDFFTKKLILCRKSRNFNCFCIGNPVFSKKCFTSEFRRRPPPCRVELPVCERPQCTNERLWTWKKQPKTNLYRISFVQQNPQTIPCNLSKN